LILLVLYGIDVAIIFSSDSGQTTEDSRGFLPLDERTRGTAFGGSAVIMSIIAFVIARKERSNLISILLFVNGGLIIVGILAVSGGLGATSLASTIAMGIILVGLGIWKVLIDRRTQTTQDYRSKIR
jgi:FtsH-binding integral membrane protein